MAVFTKGMTDDETANLTACMVSHSEKLRWSDQRWANAVVDKHSTGGVGDKTSHILAPMIVACGGRVSHCALFFKFSQCFGPVTTQLRLAPCRGSKDQAVKRDAFFVAVFVLFHWYSFNIACAGFGTRSDEPQETSSEK